MPGQLDGKANVPIHLSTCTAGSVRQDGISFCSHLLSAHLQRGCPDLMALLLLEQSEFLVVLQNFKNVCIKVFYSPMRSDEG